MHYFTIIYQQQVHVWEREDASFIKHLVRKQLLLKHGSLPHSRPHDIPKAASLPANIAVAQEPKEIEPTLKAGQYC